MPDRTLSVVRRVAVPRDQLLVDVRSSWDVSTATVSQSSRGGRPRKADGWEWRGKVRR